MSWGIVEVNIDEFISLKGVSRKLVHSVSVAEWWLCSKQLAVVDMGMPFKSFWKYIIELTL